MVAYASARPPMTVYSAGPSRTRSAAPTRSPVRPAPRSAYDLRRRRARRVRLDHRDDDVGEGPACCRCTDDAGQVRVGARDSHVREATPRATRAPERCPSR